MPNLKAAKKALRQNLAKAKINLTQKKELKKTINRFKKLVESDASKAQEMLSELFSKLDRAAKSNLIKTNKANRLKARLSKRLK